MASELDGKLLLLEADWHAQAEAHRARAHQWTIPYRDRRARGEMHPVYDFLFIYYRFAPSLLENWQPDTQQILQSHTPPPSFNLKFYSQTEDRYFLDLEKLDAKARNRLNWQLQLARATQARPAQFGCLGMHEWAMVYQGGPAGRPRHEGRLPMRLPQTEIDQIVKSRPICCSHFDAFRFFSTSAMPLNRVQPDQASRMENEQPGCLHTNMDLYKWAAKSMPWIGSELLWDCFEYAIRCRELDMRASPYDCSSLGYTAIAIETGEGRAQYENEQRALTAAAEPLRSRLIEKLAQL
ncbi:MAG: hypothetical protein ACI81V_000832 [Lentimonas sp.]|jgi:hypothetical protein